MENVIITIARQHGSGGRLIGECLAKKMGIAYYDKELISLTAKKTGFALDFVKEVEEKQTSSFLYSIYAAATVPSVYGTHTGSHGRYQIYKGYPQLEADVLLHFEK